MYLKRTSLEAMTTDITTAIHVMSSGGSTVTSSRKMERAGCPFGATGPLGVIGSTAAAGPSLLPPPWGNFNPGESTPSILVFLLFRLGVPGQVGLERLPDGLWIAQDTLQSVPDLVEGLYLA